MRGGISIIVLIGGLLIAGFLVVFAFTQNATPDATKAAPSFDDPGRDVTIDDFQPGIISSAGIIWSIDLSDGTFLVNRSLKREMKSEHTDIEGGHRFEIILLKNDIYRVSSSGDILWQHAYIHSSHPQYHIDETAVPQYTYTGSGPEAALIYSNEYEKIIRCDENTLQLVNSSMSGATINLETGGITPIQRGEALCDTEDILNRASHQYECNQTTGYVAQYTDPYFEPSIYTYNQPREYSEPAKIYYQFPCPGYFVNSSMTNSPAAGTAPLLY